MHARAQRRGEGKITCRGAVDARARARKRAFDRVARVHQSRGLGRRKLDFGGAHVSHRSASGILVVTRGTLYFARPMMMDSTSIHGAELGRPGELRLIRLVPNGHDVHCNHNSYTRSISDQPIRYSVRGGGNFEAARRFVAISLVLHTVNLVQCCCCMRYTSLSLPCDLAHEGSCEAVDRAVDALPACAVEHDRLACSPAWRGACKYTPYTSLRPAPFSA